MWSLCAMKYLRRFSRLLRYATSSITQPLSADGSLASSRKLRSEGSDIAQQLDEIAPNRSSADTSAGLVRAALKETRLGRSDRDAELASARIEHEWRMREARTRDRNLAALSARLLSFEELDAARAGYTEAARLLLTQSTIKHFGSVADHLEVDRKHERAVEACLSELMQCVVVRQRGMPWLVWSSCRKRTLGGAVFSSWKRALPKRAFRLLQIRR